MATRFLKCILLAGVFLAASCEDIPEAAPRGPGLYDLRGWNSYCDEWSCDYVYNGRASDKDINGEVGHPMTVDGVRANCVPGGDWYTSPYAASGSLPPGLSLGYNGSASRIGGIPTQRGHWIVTMNSGTITCDGLTYKGFEQVLRFHITGSGVVVQ